MKKTDSEQKLLRDFAEFIEADPVCPSRETDRAIHQLVGKDLQPAPWMVFAKLTVVEVAAGLLTLTACPQFGLGFGGHNEFLHGLHEAAPSAVFYLICGVFFVTLGAVLGGLVLSRHELHATSAARIPYFAAFSLLAYLILVTLGPEAFVAGSLAWVPGAILGNLLGFGGGIRLRRALVRR